MHEVHMVVLLLRIALMARDILVSELAILVVLVRQVGPINAILNPLTLTSPLNMLLLVLHCLLILHELNLGLRDCSGMRAQRLVGLVGKVSLVRHGRMGRHAYTLMALITI